MTPDRSASSPTERGKFLIEAGVFLGLAAIAAIGYFGFIREPSRPNVILVSIDSLRFDHVGCYGYDKPTTPVIDRLAEEGARFEWAHSTASWTLPSHLALLSGLPNPAHGVVHDQIRFAPTTPMLAETFRQAGYDTAGFFGGPYLAPLFGFGKGFRVYENCGVPTQEEVARQAGGDPQLLEQLTRRMERSSHKLPTAPKIHEQVSQYLRNGRADKPFFLFIHHWDVHYDYVAPTSLVKQFAPPGYAGPFEQPDFPFNPDIKPDMDPLAYQYLLACYDAEVRFVDRFLGEMVELLEELGLKEETYIVVTSDHGEEFFEHGLKGHRQNLHEESLRIPLVIAGPGVRKGIEIEEEARIFDVAPTILDLVGLDPDPAVVGESLVPLLEGDKPDHLRDLPILAELTHILMEGAPVNGVPQPRDTYFRHTAYGRSGRKLMRVEERTFDGEHPAQLDGEVQGKEERLYDLRRDPYEKTDLLERDADALRALREESARQEKALRELKEFLRSGRQIQELPAEVLKQLAEAGYIDGSGADGGK